jgi:hypothetical protein
LENDLRIFELRMVCLSLSIALCGLEARAQQDSHQNAPPPGQHPATDAAPPGSSQGSQTQPATSDTQNGTPQRETKEKEIQKQEQSQRVLGLYPQFSVTSRQNAPPLSPGGKFRLFAKSGFDPFAFVLAGIQAGADQAENEFPEYGEGAKGFGKRYAADFGDSVSAGFFSNYFWPVLLKEDPRYFRLGEGTIKHRFVYSLAQEFVCHTDKGGRFVNLSNILGAFSSGALSNTYHPQADRGVGLTARGATYALAYGSLGGLLSEFWPDISKKLHKHHEAAAEPEPPVNRLTP